MQDAPLTWLNGELAIPSRSDDGGGMILGIRRRRVRKEMIPQKDDY